MSSYQPELEPCLARLGTTPEDKPSFVKEVYAINDVETLRQIIIRKERERQSISNDLEVAARIGLVISETNEAIQIKLEQLERENRMYQEELSASSSHDQQSALLLSEMDERIYLTQELDQARRELTKFRKEMDGLSAQLNDMASEMVDSRSKVSLYAKKLAEVEQKLASTREVNTNLQTLLDKALTSQKQSSSNTSHLVKNIQMDLSRVVNENEQLRARIAELEHQQIECEERLAAMVIQAKEYAVRLEQAQDTIHSLSESRLHDDDELSSINGLSIVSSSDERSGIGSKESEITKGPVFSAEFRQEMQKEIERNLNLRNEIRHRIITADTSNVSEKKQRSSQQEGLKYLVSERENGGLASLSTSTSSSTNSSSILSTVMKKNDTPVAIEEELQQHEQQPQPPKPPVLRPASFLTGFGGFGTEAAPGLGIGNKAGANFITRGIPPRTFTSRGNNEPSISTKFFQRITSRLDAYDKKIVG
ncbi:hypothetical protein K501DRAFT_246525 [Backusella circina FSU 941]|nr:hypothetical protein K501DRAFT_246525 [Backusella circina FSU 941]